ncbi:4'-phosphopantetheinyl transferase superfamily protein [Brachybacterium sp. YJGR34]|uniref:4'-phosphopantetheinyl transferase family protein n=1 Tax=Brachybacterium sp. YJGR34 TaxID=2059911 RepID=UPI000E0B9A70|nr:4'-phosphopantetheinyl transferase superfamily protein [Brachybacterium sp. YJGR34]
MNGDADGIVGRHGSEEDADAVLRTRVAALLALPAAEVLVGRSCPRCGSSGHGRPWARARGARTEVPVSLSRCGPHLLTAVAPTGRLGVDLESVAAVARGWDEELVLHPSERGVARSPRERAALWARKEAILKALGTGLTTEMSSLREDDAEIVDLAAPPGHVAALARL